VLLEISSENEKVAVEIVSDAGRRKIRLGGTEILCDWIRLADGHYSLILDGTVLDAIVSVDTDACTVTSRAGTFSFRIRDPRRAAAGKKIEEGASGLQRVCAEMPGKIIRVTVHEGDTVVQDESLLVLEAMKMQNDIRAPKSGVVREIAATPGMAINTGDFLLSIES